MPHARLNGTDMRQTDFTGSDLYDVYFYNANLRRSNFDGANLTEVVMTHAGLNGATLCEAVNTVVPVLNTGEAVPARLHGALADDVNFDGAGLVDALFDTRKPTDPKIKDRRTGLEGAHFPYANLQGANFRRAELAGADFRGANLTDADFTEAEGIDQITTNGDTVFCRTKGLKGPPKGDNCLKEDLPELKTCRHDGKTWWEAVYGNKPPKLEERTSP